MAIAVGAATATPPPTRDRCRATRTTGQTATKTYKKMADLERHERTRETFTAGYRGNSPFDVQG
ncbi:hypothetical protein EHS25_004746 [Saitozyma podzolica]|uniref:Uncharacterized protein n=1 Tax=Saitozyma podzolica TaxID=1890683 RepID=A0A427Y2P1_9TREE|nr:hypothetical protein EHS25_004746 [Saitozyma podzolica]